MTLTQLQRKIIDRIGESYEKLNRMMTDPKTRRERVVITIELDVYIEEEPEEEETNFKGAFRWDYDHQEAHKAIDDKIRAYFEDQLGQNTLRRMEDEE